MTDFPENDAFPTVPDTAEELLRYIQEQHIEFVDLRFQDFPGFHQAMSMPAHAVNETVFESGVGFDGSCIRDWAKVNEGDMLLVPVPSTAHIDPFSDRPTLAMVCDVKDPVTKKLFSRDPRSVARRANDYLKQTGIADQAIFSPEIEFFLFDQASFDVSMNRSMVVLDSTEGIWNRGSTDPFNLGHQVRSKEGLFPVTPVDRLHDLRAQMVNTLQSVGIMVEQHHHEVATGGQCEIDLMQNDLVEICDNIVTMKYIVKNHAARHGKMATFMPKPLYDDNGSGMHSHFSLRKDGQPIFAGRKYAGLSREGQYAIGGILKHAAALCAFTNPTTNSYRRLMPGYEAPTRLVYASRNRGAAIRIPVYTRNPDTKRLEIRFPDPSCNPYLAFSAIMMAALDGIENKIDPGDPIDGALETYEADNPSKPKLPTTPNTLSEALVALESDHAFLRKGNVFSESLIAGWIAYKRANEIDAIRERPHPYEFCMYFDT